MPVNVPSAAGSYYLRCWRYISVMLSGGASSSSMSKSDEKQMIQRDGTISLPNLGKIALAGLTLAQAEETLATMLHKASPGTSAYFLYQTKRYSDNNAWR
jgi:protein involved in polysaccharide export with SLBB domain